LKEVVEGECWNEAVDDECTIPTESRFKRLTGTLSSKEGVL